MRPFWHQEHEVPIERVQQVITDDDDDDEVTELIFASTGDYVKFLSAMSIFRKFSENADIESTLCS